MPEWVACEQCDAMYSRAVLQREEIAYCTCCGGELYRHPGSQLKRLLPLTLASLMVFVVANVFPIVQMEIQGIHGETTLWGAVRALGGQDMPLIASLVLGTTLVFPLLQLLALLYLLTPLAYGITPPGACFLLRGIQALRPWGMIEVFLLGVLVAVVKLSDMATIIPGVALWALGALTVLLTAILSCNPRDLWQLLVIKARHDIDATAVK